MYAVTGATDRTGAAVARRLLRKGERVRVIGRGGERLKSLAAEGGEPSDADLTDEAALTRAFVGAKAVYVMLPPNLATHDCWAFQTRVTQAIAAAVEGAGVSYAVTLSSIGADKPDGTGSVASLPLSRTAAQPHCWLEGIALAGRLLHGEYARRDWQHSDNGQGRRPVPE